MYSNIYVYVLNIRHNPIPRNYKNIPFENVIAVFTTSLRGGIKIYKIKYSKEVDATVSGKKLEVQKNPNNPSY
jgi:hypothetical protein